MGNDRSSEMPKYRLGEEPESIRLYLNALLQDIEAIFPDKIIVWEEWNHERWDKAVHALCRALGYSQTGDLLSAYGFFVVRRRTSSQAERAVQTVNTSEHQTDVGAAGRAGNAGRENITAKKNKIAFGISWAVLIVGYIISGLLLEELASIILVFAEELLLIGIPVILIIENTKKMQMSRVSVRAALFAVLLSFACASVSLGYLIDWYVGGEIFLGAVIPVIALIALGICWWTAEKKWRQMSPLGTNENTTTFAESHTVGKPMAAVGKNGRMSKIITIASIFVLAGCAVFYISTMFDSGELSAINPFETTVTYRLVSDSGIMTGKISLTKYGDDDDFEFEYSGNDFCGYIGNTISFDGWLYYKHRLPLCSWRRLLWACLRL